MHLLRGISKKYQVINGKLWGSYISWYWHLQTGAACMWMAGRLAELQGLNVLEADSICISNCLLEIMEDYFLPWVFFFFQLCFSFLHSSEQASHYQRNMLWLVLHLISPLMSSVCLVTAQTAEDGVYILTDPPLCVLLTFNSANISLSNVRLRNLKYSWEDKNVLQVQPAGLLHGLKCVFCYKWVGLQGRRFIRIWTLIT